MLAPGYSRALETWHLVASETREVSHLFQVINKMSGSNFAVSVVSQ